MALVFAIVTGILALVRDIRTMKSVAAIPIASVALAMLAVGPCSSLVRGVKFSSDRPRYEALIASLDEHVVPLGNGARVLKGQEKGVAYLVSAERMHDGVLIVEFVTSVGVFGKHHGFVYSSSGMLPDDSQIVKMWSHRENVVPLWFRVRT